MIIITIWLILAKLIEIKIIIAEIIKRKEVEWRSEFRKKLRAQTLKSTNSFTQKK